MANLATWIEEALGPDETIEAVVIGEGDSKYIPNEIRKKQRKILDEVISWEIARPLLDYEFDDGFGGQDCNTVFVWTNKRVIFVSEYDGATGLKYVPRNPINCEPYWGGV